MPARLAPGPRSVLGVLLSSLLLACSARPLASPVSSASPPVVASPDVSVASPPPEPPVAASLESLADSPATAPQASAPAFPDLPFTLHSRPDRVIEVYPPTSTERRPLMVFLHATCMQPGPVCDAFGMAGRDASWLVCPAGPSQCYGEPDWSGSGASKAAFLEGALREVEQRIAPFVDAQAGVLVGWSRGAYAARDILDAAVRPQAEGTLARRFTGLVVLAASTPFDAARLRAAGIRRVVMAAGDRDGARGAMVARTASLAAAGLETRYVSLGPIGHEWPADFEARMSEPLTWVGQSP